MTSSHNVGDFTTFSTIQSCSAGLQIGVHNDLPGREGGHSECGTSGSIDLFASFGRA